MIQRKSVAVANSQVHNTLAPGDSSAPQQAGRASFRQNSFASVPLRNCPTDLSTLRQPLLLLRLRLILRSSSNRALPAGSERRRRQRDPRSHLSTKNQTPPQPITLPPPRSADQGRLCRGSLRGCGGSNPKRGGEASHPRSDRQGGGETFRDARPSRMMCCPQKHHFFTA